MIEQAKISFGMIVINGEPFIKYCLESIYPHAHEILVVEGSVEKYKHAASSDGHSLDGTLKIIREFPDPENKIKLIQTEGFWPEKDEMSNAYMECCTGDYIWQIDVDEFYKSEDIEKVRKHLTENPEITRIDFQTVNFWRGFKANIQGASYCFGSDQFRRLFKYKPGYRYLTHRPPTIIDNDGNICCDENLVTAEDMVKRLNIRMYHYSYVFQENVKSKVDYYSRMGWGAGCDDGVKWVENEWSKFTNPLRIHLIDFPPSWISPFRGEHPVVIQQMLQDLDYKENPTIEDFLISNWVRYASIGNNICNICKEINASQINKYHAAGLVLKELMLPTDIHKLHADYTIFKSAAKIIGMY